MMALCSEACASGSGGESSGSEVSLHLYLSSTNQSAGEGNVLVHLRDLQCLWEKVSYRMVRCILAVMAGSSAQHVF